ncbi:hypothetical protein H0X48_01380 [Candidatus Dependentiae bacterium]|nr:hypothetical protein [Candidatus Dependentiae bacterium]
MRVPYFKQFNTSLYWNLIDSVGTQILLLVHHLLVRSFLGSSFHGSFSCLLSLLYLGITLFNFGFDTSLAPFLTTIISSKQQFSKLVKYYIGSQSLILLVSALLAALFFLFLSTIPVFDVPLYTLFGYTFLCESAKKTAKSFLQLNFLNKTTALVEVLGMLGYLLFFWATYYQGFLTTTVHTWVILGFISTGQALTLLFRCYTIYKHLPKENLSAHTPELLSLKALTKIRFFTFSNQMVVQLFSGNFLVPLCALRLGSQQASFLKIVTSFSQILSTVAQKVFGIASNAVFAHLTDKPLEERRATFSTLSYKLHQALYVLGIFLVINIQVLIRAYQHWHLGGDISLTSWASVYVFLILSFIESFFALYERWYTVEKKAHIFFIFNLLSFIVLYITLPYMSLGKLFFSILVGVRLGMFLALSGFSFYYWNIKPTFKLEKKLLIYTIVVSFLFNSVTKIASTLL